jgi:hypothetical protein
VSLADFALRLAAALGAGIPSGAGRQFLQRMAGLRTNALVAGGAALFVTLGPLMGDKASPDRVAANIVTGVGFLGAGVLIRQGANIRGINTAATLWCCAAVGRHRRVRQLRRLLHRRRRRRRRQHDPAPHRPAHRPQPRQRRRGRACLSVPGRLPGQARRPHPGPGPTTPQRVGLSPARVDLPARAHPDRHEGNRARTDRNGPRAQGFNGWRRSYSLRLLPGSVPGRRTAFSAFPPRCSTRQRRDEAVGWRGRR